MTALAGVAAGLILFLALRWCIDHGAMREWKRKRRAYVMGLYLFGDDPVILLRSAGQIARANGMLLLHALPALAVAAPLVGWIAISLDRSLAPAASVATARWTAACEPRLVAPGWLRVDSPPVHLPALREVSWRVRAVGKGGGAVRAGCGGVWVNAAMQSEEPAEEWIWWFGLTAWATAWVLDLAPKLLRFFA